MLWLFGLPLSAVTVSAGTALPAYLQPVCPVTIDLSAASLHFACRAVYCRARFPIFQSPPMTADNATVATEARK